MTRPSTEAAPGKTPMRRDSVTWAGYLSLALFTFFLNIQGNILPFLRDEFALSYREVTLHPAALAGGFVICGMFGDRFAVRLGRRLSIGVGLLGLAVGAMILVVAPSPVVSIAACLGMGTVGGLILIVVPAMLSAWHGENRSVAIGEANGICYIASLSAALLTGVFVAMSLGWRSAIIFGVLFGAALTYLFRNVRLPAFEPRPAGASGRLPPAYWLYWLALFGFVAIEQTTLVWAPEFLEQTKGLSRAVAAASAGIFSVGMLIGRMSASPLLNRISPATALYGSLAIALPAYVVYWLAPWASVALPALFILGLGTALLYPLVLSLAIGTSGPLGDLASTRASMSSGGSILIVPAVVGTLADNFGLSNALLLLPVLALFGLVSLIGARLLETSRPVIHPAQ